MSLKRFISYHAWRSLGNWGVWLRLFGRGISITNSQPLFSERTGRARNYFRVMGVKFELLK